MAITEGSPPEADFSTGYLTAKEEQARVADEKGGNELLNQKPVRPGSWLKKLLNNIKSPKKV